MRAPLALLFALTASAAAQPVAVTDVSVVDVEAGAVVPGQTVVVDGDRIVAVGPTASVAVPDGATVVDGAGRFLIPGLWDMHVHSSSDRITRETLLPLHIANGVTGVRDMKGDCFEPCDEISSTVAQVNGWRRDIARGALVGPRIVAGSDLLNSPPPGEPSSVEHPATEAEGRALAHLLVARGVDFAKPYSMLSREAYFGLADEAAALGLPVAGHVPLRVRMSEAVAAGQRSIEHQIGVIEECSAREDELRERLLANVADGASAVGLLMEMVESHDEEKCAALIAQLARAETWSVPTLLAQRFFVLDPADPRFRYITAPERAFWEEKLSTQAEDWPEDPRFEALHVAITGAMHRAGVKVLAGSDAAAPGVFAGFDLHDELRRLVGAGMTPAEAIRAATLGPAEYFEATDSLGTVAPGRVADLVLLDANPLDDIAHTQRIRAVVARGRLFDRAALDGLLEGVARAASAPRLTDPGPVWQGITDTTAFRHRIEAHVAESESLFAAVRAVEGAHSAASTALPFVRGEGALARAQQLARIALHAHPDAAFRAVAQATTRDLDERQAAVAVDRALYDALASVDREALPPDLGYVVERRLADFRRMGVALSEADRAHAATLRAQISDLGDRFEQAIFADLRTIRVHPDSLAGLPPDWVERATAGDPEADGRYAVRLTPPVVFPLLSFAERADLRERAARAFFSRGDPANAPVLDSLRTLRHELAVLLGHDSWADYQLAPSMAGSPERVAQFLAEVDSASAEAARDEADALLAIRRRTDPDATRLQQWDLLYWENALRREAHGFDAQALRAYFPVEAVRDGVLAAYGELFGLTFRPAPETPVWSADATPYEVWEDGVLVGRVVLDLHPRPGKFGHFAAFPLRTGGGDVPEAALLGNFPGGGDGDPGLLAPQEVRTFIHEMGHVLHTLLAGRKAVVGQVEEDFGEAPAQLFEAWAMDADVLQRFARHHETGEPIPDELVAALPRAEGFGRALRARDQLWPSALALGLYAAPPDEAPTVDVERRAAQHLVAELPPWYRLALHLPHLNGYGARYYTYLWSEVIARDLLTGFDADGLLDPEAGRRYRELVLEPSGTAPSVALVERFLGRPADTDAWRAWLEGDVPADPPAPHDLQDP